MARDFAKDFYNSKAWRDCAKAYKASKFGICERCKQPKGTIVHHKVYLNEENINDVTVTLNQENLELLCIDCHHAEHFKKYSSLPDGYTFDENGQAVPVYSSLHNAL